MRHISSNYVYVNLGNEAFFQSIAKQVFKISLKSLLEALGNRGQIETRVDVGGSIGYVSDA